MKNRTNIHAEASTCTSEREGNSPGSSLVFSFLRRLCVNWNSGVGHESIFFLVSFITVMGLLPLLLKEKTCEDCEGYQRALQGEYFRFIVYANVSISIPFSLELLVDYLTQLKLSKFFMTRLSICFAMGFTSILDVIFSLNQSNVLAAWVILHMRTVMVGTLLIHEIFIRNKRLMPNPVVGYTALIFATVGVLVMAHFGYDDRKRQIGKVIASGAIVLFFYAVAKHIYMVLRGQLKNWHRKERVIFEVLVFGLVIGNISTHLIWTNDDFYGVSVTSFLILQYNMTIFLVLMSLLVTMKYRQDFVRLQRKIGVKSMFVKYVSHEVRTPLNCCILGIAYLKGLITAPAECFISEASIILEELAEGCDMAVDFMNNLLLYEKVDTMELPLYLKREDLSQLCVQASKTFKMSAKHLEINLNVDIHSSLTSTSSLCGVKNTYCRADVNIDGPKVLIVLRNLMSNAMKFTPKGGNVTLSVLPVDLSCGKSKLTPDRTSAKINAAEPEDVTHFRLILSDTGRGLSAQEQAQLFTKIVQFSPNENQKGGGSGIGLYLSHKIMANHKLKVQVCSAGEVGKGTEFFIDFPKFETAVAPDLNISDSRPISSSWTSIILCRSRNSPLLPLFDTICMRRRVATTIVASTATDVSAGPSNVSDASDRSGSEDGSRFAGGSLPRLVTHSMRKSQSSVRSMDDSQSLHDLSILIVDDSFLNRKMISRTLHQKRVGSKFQCLDDGDELLADFGLLEETLHNRCADDCDVVPMTQLKDEKKYDIILLDDNMTRMNGSEAVKVLRSRGYNGLIVGLTGCALEEDLTSFCEAGVDYALPKPFVVDDFIRIVKTHF